MYLNSLSFDQKEQTAWKISKHSMQFLQNGQEFDDIYHDSSQSVVDTQKANNINHPFH